MKLVLKNIITGKSIEFDNITDQETSKLYYNFTINIPEINDDGEYNYELYEDDEIVASGLCLIGNYENENNKEYVKSKTVRKQYGKK